MSTVTAFFRFFDYETGKGHAVYRLALALTLAAQSPPQPSPQAPALVAVAAPAPASASVSVMAPSVQYQLVPVVTTPLVYAATTRPQRTWSLAPLGNPLIWLGNRINRVHVINHTILTPVTPTPTPTPTPVVAPPTPAATPQYQFVPARSPRP